MSLEETAENIALEFSKTEWITEPSYYSLIWSIIRSFEELSSINEETIPVSEEFSKKLSNNVITSWENSPFLSENKLELLQSIVENAFREIQPLPQ